MLTSNGRYNPVLRSGMALWTLGAGLKILFGLQTPISVYVITLIIEGIGIGFVLQPALVALQALAGPEDRAVATSTRNLMRMLGSVVGLAVSTAIQLAVTEANVPNSIPAGLRTEVINGMWQPGDQGSAEWESTILNAKMKGVRAVFIMLVPLVGICLLACWWIPDTVLEGDHGKQHDNANKSSSEK